MLKATLTVGELPEGQAVPGIELTRGTDGGQSYAVYATRDVVYLHRPGATTRFVELNELLAAMVNAAPEPKGGR